MSALGVIVVATSADIKAQVIASAVIESVLARSDMTPIEPRCVTVADVDGLLESTPTSARCAVILAGVTDETEDAVERWLADRADLVVIQIDIGDGTVRMTVRDAGLDSVLTALRDLAARAGAEGEERATRVRLRAVDAPPAPEVVPLPEPPANERPFLDACVAWLEALLRDAVTRVPDNGDVHGLSVTRATVLQGLEREAHDPPHDLVEAEEAMFAALAAADATTEPLAALFRRLGFDALEVRMILLALAPELDARFQRCIGFLLDEMGRRVGTFGLYAALLGASASGVRADLARSGALSRWLVFEKNAGQPVAADEPLRLDPFLVDWLLGERGALRTDARARRALQLAAWPGAALLERREELAKAGDLVDRLLCQDAAWIVLDGDDAAGWRALLELGARERCVGLIRVEAGRLAELDVVDIEDCARRLGRLARLTAAPVVIDVTGAQRADGADDWLRVLFATAAAAGCRAAVICDSEVRIVRLLGQTPFELEHGQALPAAARAAAMKAAARGADAYLTEDKAAAMAERYPLQIDGLERAMHLARSRPLNYALDDCRQARFAAACMEVAAEGVSHLAARIDPVFDLDEVVLPPDRRRQLVEIVDNVRLASQVLDGWKFRDQLPYGRGVTALFFGPPGTGKTMAAIGIARRLGIQILRVDLSKVMSKYIGDTEKHVDQVFTDAQRSGSAIVIDEAEALLGKRSEVKDAHDRYANIEVAYLLQRMEAYEGLAILTTNMRQTLDPAFVRRLRFIIDFPRPDADARERIWRQCLPAGSHALDDQTFRLLGRRIDITGGHIRQITLRAAFVAAAAGALINREHIAHAARSELAKLGMPAIDLDPVRSREAA